MESDRKYAPPPPSDPHRFPGGKRTKDDLHEWSIYRQNLTSSIAGSLLGLDSKGPLTYGDFQMHDQTVESVLQHGRKEDFMLGNKGDIYLRFGLPRISIQPSAGLEPEHLSPGGISNSGRKVQSEMDLRRAVLDSQTTRGPYMNAGNHRSSEMLLSTSARGFGGDKNKLRQFASADFGLDMIDVSHSAIQHDFNHSDGSDSHVPMDFRIDGLANKSGISARLHPTIPGIPLRDEGAFLQGKRHHSHYFSNLELFTHSAAYNYLRYAKAEDLQTNVAKQPHLVLRNLSFEADTRSTFDRFMLRSPKRIRLLENVSFELRGGETLALLYTSEEEVKTLLSLLSNMHNIKGRTEGTLMVNGITLKPKYLGDRIAYACDHDLHPHLTVEEHLKMISNLVKPATNAFRTKSMIAQLIQTLALTPFQNRPIGEVGRTEKQRVKVACQILLDTDIIVLDNLTKEMDLYDAAFLIDYLRDWASKLNRIVIMAINPPTCELLSMFYKATILASGRLVYYGKSSKMLEYFESLNYPCPLFKNPCDYYVDLVTSDYLTVEASMESGERIKRLGDLWLSKAAAIPDPGPPGSLPPKVDRVNPLSAIFWIYYRFWLLFFNRPLQYLKDPLITGLLSVLLGAIFYGLSDTAGGVSDRFGLFYALLTLFLLPELFLNIERVVKERSFVYEDTRHRLYSKLSFLIAKICFDFPLALVTYAAYVVPVYFMAELQSASKPGGGVIFGEYLALTTLYCIGWRFFASTVAYTFQRSSVSASVLGVVMTGSALLAGVTLHPSDFSSGLRYLRYASPTQWSIQLLSRQEFLGNSSGPQELNQFLRPTSELFFKCSPKTVSIGNIVTSLPCPIRTGSQAITFANLTLRGAEDQSALHYIGVPVIAAFGLICFILNCCLIYCNHRPYVKLRHRTH